MDKVDFSDKLSHVPETITISVSNVKNINEPVLYVREDIVKHLVVFADLYLSDGEDAEELEYAIGQVKRVMGMRQ